MKPVLRTAIEPVRCYLLVVAWCAMTAGACGPELPVSRDASVPQTEAGAHEEGGSDDVEAGAAQEAGSADAATEDAAIDSQVRDGATDAFADLDSTVPDVAILGCGAACVLPAVCIAQLDGGALCVDPRTTIWEGDGTCAFACPDGSRCLRNSCEPPPFGGPPLAGSVVGPTCTNLLCPARQSRCEQFAVGPWCVWSSEPLCTRRGPCPPETFCKEPGRCVPPTGTVCVEGSCLPVSTW